MVLEGTVRNVVDFGAFVDIGLKNDGLVHISKMSKQKIKHTLDVCNVGDILDVYVYDIDKYAFIKVNVQTGDFERTSAELQDFVFKIELPEELTIKI